MSKTTASTKTKPRTQQDKVLSHLKRYGTITPMQALRNYGAYRLSAIILELRKDGHDIETELVSNPKNPSPGRYAKYHLNA